MKRKVIIFGLVAALLFCSGGCSCTSRSATEPAGSASPQIPAETLAPAATSVPQSESEPTSLPDELSCDHDMQDKMIPPTCTLPGYTEHRCSRCGLVIVDEETQAAGHAYQLTEKKEATCTEDGFLVYCCDICGDTISAVIPATGHHVVTDNEVEATCESTGLSQGSHCDVCGEILEQQIVTSKVDHRYENGKCVWCGKLQSGSGSSGSNELPEIPG